MAKRWQFKLQKVGGAPQARGQGKRKAKDRVLRSPAGKAGREKRRGWPRTLGEP